MDAAAKQEALNALAARIFNARTTFHKVCKRAGVSPSTISRWRANIEMMQAPTLAKLEDAVAEIEGERTKAA